MKCFCLTLCFITVHSVGAHAALRPRIISGENANVKEFRYQASLRVKSIHFCGGIIISDRHILTAAHCFTVSRVQNQVLPPYTYVRVHTGTSYSYKETGYPHPVASVTLHPKWTGRDEPVYTNDIAVVKITDRIIFDKRQQMIALPSHDVVSGTIGYVTGWGRTSTGRNSKAAEQLQKLEMTLITNTECHAKMPVKVQPNQLCGYAKSGRGCCIGDSGGPVVANKEVVGVISWVLNGNCASGVPEVYTNVYAHKNFIISTMNK